MIKQLTLNTAIAAILSLSAAYPAYAAVPNTFTEGQAAYAAEVNANFTDLDGRVTTLEGGAGISTWVTIDCGDDSDALINATITANTTYNITGACAGPIFVTEDGVRLTGGDNTNDSIILPNGNGGIAAVNADGAHDLRVTNLFLNLRNTTLADEAAGIYARNSFVRMRDSRIEGGSVGVNPYRNAIVRLDGTNLITEFAEHGLMATDNSNINTRGATTVTSTRIVGESLTALYASRNSTIEIRNGITITLPAALSSGSGDDIRAVLAVSQGIINIRDGGTVSIGGFVGSKLNSSVRIQTGTITGDIDVGEASSLFMDSSEVTIIGNAEVHDSGSWFADGGGSITGTIRVFRGGVVYLNDMTQSSSDDYAIYLNLNSSMDAQNSNLGRFFVTSNSALQLNDSLVKGGEMHLGAVGSISNTQITAEVTISSNAGAHFTGATDFNSNNLINLDCNTTSLMVAGTVINILNIEDASAWGIYCPGGVSWEDLM
jgi:hypothetical protein